MFRFLSFLAYLYEIFSFRVSLSFALLKIVLDVMLLLIDENHKLLSLQMLLLLQVIAYVEVGESDMVRVDVSLDSMMQTDLYISWLPSLWVLELVLLLCSFVSTV